MLIKFCEKILRRFEERKKIYTDKILSGSCQTFEEYRLNIGKYKGIEESEVILKQVYKNMFETKNFNEMEEGNEQESN